MASQQQAYNRAAALELVGLRNMENVMETCSQARGIVQNFAATPAAEDVRADELREFQASLQRQQARIHSDMFFELREWMEQMDETMGDEVQRALVVMRGNQAVHRI